MQDDLVAQIVRHADWDPAAIAAHAEDEAERAGQTDVAPSLSPEAKAALLRAYDEIRVTISDQEAAEGALKEQVVPRASQAPGFVTGHWTRKDNTGLSMIIFESEDAANGASEQIRANVPPGVTLEDVEVREVLAHA
jgi:hypothetical protein